MEKHRIEIGASQDDALEAVREAADFWGASFEPQGTGARLGLPVVRGLYRGLLLGHLTVEPTPEGSALRLDVEELHQELNRSAFVILLLGGAGGITACFWALYPPLLPLAPLGAVMAVAAWLLVASRLRTSGPEDFLKLVAALSAAPPPEEPPEKSAVEFDSRNLQP